MISVPCSMQLNKIGGHCITMESVPKVNNIDHVVATHYNYKMGTKVKGLNSERMF